MGGWLNRGVPGRDLLGERHAEDTARQGGGALLNAGKRWTIAYQLVEDLQHTLTVLHHLAHAVLEELFLVGIMASPLLQQRFRHVNVTAEELCGVSAQK